MVLSKKMLFHVMLTVVLLSVFSVSVNAQIEIWVYPPDIYL